jgi:choline-sulfatase
MAKQLNFVLFNPDEMRAESLGCYGHSTARTPHLNALAEDGVRFEQAHVQHTVCTPSRCSFMTGWYPHVSGHRTLWHMLRPHEPNLLRYLKGAGYQVGWFGKNDLLAPASFADSVDVATSGVRAGPPGVGHAERAFGKDHAGFQSFLMGPRQNCTIEDMWDSRMVRRGIDFISRRDPSRPFCLYLPIGMPHCPYTCPPPYYEMHDPDALHPLRPAGLSGKPDFHAMIRRYRRLDELGEDVFRKINAVYLGMITAVDQMLGWLLDALDEMRLTEETVVIVFSDHGDWAGDWGLVEKWSNGLDDTLTRVPFIVRCPGGARAHVVKDPIEVQDLFATVMELAGITPSHSHFSRSLASQLHGAAGDAGRAVFAEGGYDPFEPQAFEGRAADGELFRNPDDIYYLKGLQQQQQPQSVCRSTMIRTATHKLIRRPGGVSELYDLAADPRELANRYGDAALAGVQAQLERRMLDWLIGTSDAPPADKDPRTMPRIEPGGA